MGKLKDRLRKWMPKELSGIAQMAAPFVSGGGHPLYGAALSYLGQARAGEGKINPYKIAMSAAPGFAYGKGAYFGSDPDKFNHGIGSLSNAAKGMKSGNKYAGSSLRRLLTGYGTGESEGILNYGNTDFGTGLADKLDSSLYGSIDTDFKYGKKEIGENIIEKTLPDGSIQKISKPIYERFTEKTTMPKAGLFGKGSERFKLGNLKDSAIVNALTKQGSPFDAAAEASKKIKIGDGVYELVKSSKAKQLSLLKLGSEGLSIYSYIDSRKELKTAEEAAAAVKAQLIADGVTDQTVLEAAAAEAFAIFDKLSAADFGLAHGGRINRNMGGGFEEEGIGSLDTGASNITYEGNEGPRSPEQEQQMLMTQLQEEYEKYVFEMEEQGIQPMSLEQFMEQALAEGQMSEGPPLPNDPTEPVNPFGPKPIGPVLPREMAAYGGRINRNMGGIASMQRQDVTPPGMELDLRVGGFIPIGAEEKADDVKARVSKNEFVMTADAVKAAGGGSVNEGAKQMYQIMKQLESQVA